MVDKLDLKTLPAPEGFNVRDGPPSGVVFLGLIHFLIEIVKIFVGLVVR